MLTSPLTVPNHGRPFQALTACPVQCRCRCPGVVTVATVMKQSRQEALCSQGLLHLHPIGGVCYFPMLAGAPPQLQPPHDALLIKATDFLERRKDPRGGLAVALSAQVHQV